jgi:GT2 family glycosyltransferase
MAQRYRPIEVIVVDDGSTDDTASRVADFQGPLIYHRQANRGMAGARNQGIALAQGDLISFLDDDDLWEPDYLATVVPLFTAEPDVAAVYTGFQSLDGTGGLLPQGGGRVVPPELLYDALVDGGFFPACCLTVRKQVLEEIGVLDETLKGNDDWDLVLRLARHRRVVGLRAPLAIHREHSGGLSSNYEHMLEDNLRAVAKHFGPEEGLAATWPDLRKRAYSAAYLLAAVGHLLQNDLDLGCHRFVRAVEIYPPILQRVSTWYDIACSYQPKGWRGHVDSLDLMQSKRLVDTVMACTIRSLEPGSVEDRMFDGMRAAADMAVGMLAYQKSDLKTARMYFHRALALRPSLLSDTTLMSRYIKSLLGSRFLDAARQARRGTST